MNRFAFSLPTLVFFATAVFASLLAVPAAQAAGGFEFRDTQGQHLDVVRDGKLVARYMYAYDMSTPEKREETYKPYLHLFDAEGKELITKGPGGEFTHHRGLFIGWSKLNVGGKVYDRWHMKGGEQIHREFLVQTPGAESATFTSLVEWTGADKKPILREERTFTFSAPAGSLVQVEQASKLKAVAGDVRLDGDAEHAGLHFRPAADVEKSKTTYVFPVEKPQPKTDRDYPWVAEQFTLRGKQYGVVYVNVPGNPKDAQFSAYRNYGRFGAFFRDTISDGQEKTIRVRILVVEGALPAVPEIGKLAAGS